MRAFALFLLCLALDASSAVMCRKNLTVATDTTGCITGDTGINKCVKWVAGTDTYTIFTATGQYWMLGARPGPGTGYSDVVLGVACPSDTTLVAMTAGDYDMLIVGAGVAETLNYGFLVLMFLIGAGGGWWVFGPKSRPIVDLGG